MAEYDLSWTVQSRVSKAAKHEEHWFKLSEALVSRYLKGIVARIYVVGKNRNGDTFIQGNVWYPVMIHGMLMMLIGGDKGDDGWWMTDHERKIMMIMMMTLMMAMGMTIKIFHLGISNISHQPPNIRTPNVRLQPSPPSRQPSAVCYVQTYRSSVVKRDGSMEEFPFTSPWFHPGIDIDSGKRI